LFSGLAAAAYPHEKMRRGRGKRQFPLRQDDPQKPGNSTAGRCPLTKPSERPMIKRNLRWVFLCGCGLMGRMRPFSSCRTGLFFFCELALVPGPASAALASIALEAGRFSEGADGLERGRAGRRALGRRSSILPGVCAWSEGVAPGLGAARRRSVAPHRRRGEARRFSEEKNLHLPVASANPRRRRSRVGHGYTKLSCAGKPGRQGHSVCIPG